MARKGIKALLVAALGLFMVLSCNISTAQEIQNYSAEGHIAERKSEKLDPSKIIMEHIKDAHDFHFFSIGSFHATIPLPIILYSKEKGLEIFSSSRFGNEGKDIFNGYELDENQKITSSNGTNVYDLSITKNVMQMFIALALLVWVMTAIATKSKAEGSKKAPSGLQNAIEPIITFIRDDVAKPNLGKKANFYLPYLLTVFFFILINSLIGLLPGSANVAGNIAFTAVLGIVSLIVILCSTNRHFWSHIFWPPGVPFLVKLILIPIELAGVLLIKPAALIIRLFANMVAGHIVILSFIVLIFIFGAMATTAGYGFSPLSVAFAVFIYLIEILVAFIQAYIFANLTAVFIGQSLEGGHGEGNGHDDPIIA